MEKALNNGRSAEDSKISFWKKVCYGSGAAGGNVVSTSLAVFLLSYYTDTALIGGAAIGSMYFITRILDGVTDLAMGSIVDKTNTRIGKARPWLIISAPLVCIGMILILNVPAGWNEAMKLVYAYCTYTFLMAISYTIFGIAHAALLARITRNVNERNTISAASSICNNLAGMVIGTAMTALILNLGWTVTSIILGVLAGIFILIPGLTIKETVGMTENGLAKNELAPMKQQLKAALANKYFYIALMISALMLIMTANGAAAQIYYCNVVLRKPEFMMQLMSFGQAPGILIIFAMPWFTKKFSKRIFMAAGALLLVIGSVICGLAGENTTLILIGAMLRALGTGPIFAGTYAFIADACDYGEWKTGIRSEGLFAASSSIGAKVGIGFGSGLTGWFLAIFSYNPALEVQTATTIFGITFAFSWFGAIVGALLFVCILFMNVEKYLPQIRQDLLNGNLINKEEVQV
jgi:GPH family glycoside/pentoside/hexuronide:cation symporter